MTLKACFTGMLRAGAPLALAIAMASAAEPVALDSPRDYQVFQRETRTMGTVVVAGHAEIECDSADARISGAWRPLAFDAKTRAFRGDLSAPAGGWYRFEVRLRKGDATVGDAAVEHVGVGEVFVVAGQSNATNYGEVRQQTRTRMVAAFSGQAWSIADDPQPGVQDKSKDGSFIPAFGDAMYEKYRVPIGIASVGHGSMSVRQWLPKGQRFAIPPTVSKFVKEVGVGSWEADGTLFEGMMRIVCTLGRGGFRALLWHQGESDAHQSPGHDISPDEYRRMMEIVIRTSREQAGWNFPWFVAQVSYHSPLDIRTPEIRDAQRSLWDEGLALPGPDTDQLTGDNRQNGGKGVHFSAKGLQAHGKMWADEVGVWLDGVLR